MRSLLPVRLLTVLAAGLTVVCAAHAQFSSYTIISAPLKVNTNTTIPGASLKPGSYTIRVIDNLKDRYILAVADDRKDTKDKDLATFIGILQHDPLPGQGATGPILWANAPGKTDALRGFSFANGQSFEFVYPKDKAVELAKINASSVPAIDPESEGMPVDNKLSLEDRKVVSLWMLTSTRVGPGEGVPAIEAKHYQTAANTELARNEPPPQPGAHPNYQTAPVQSEAHAGGSSDKTKRRAVEARLPQTASDLPLALLFSGVMVAAGFGVRARRRSLSLS